MDNLSTTNTRIPFLPLALESAIRAAQSLAECLANAAPELSRFSHDQISTRRYMAQQCADEAKKQTDLVQNNIESHLQTMGKLFLAFRAYLLKNGTYVETLAIANLNPSDEDKLAKALVCQVQAEEARERVLAVIQTLGFDSTQLQSIDLLEPGALFTACEERLEDLQKSWKSLNASYVSKALRLQTRSLQAVAAHCLVNLAETALDEVLYVDEVPAGLEDVLVKLEAVMTHPFSGAWPQSIAAPMDQPTVASTSAGDAPHRQRLQPATRRPVRQRHALGPDAGPSGRADRANHWRQKTVATAQRREPHLPRRRRCHRDSRLV